MVSFGVIPAGISDWQVVEVAAEDRLVDPQRPVDVQPGRGAVEIALGVLEVDPDLLVRPADAVDRVDEVHVPGRTAELAVGRRLQPGIALHPHGVGDRRVLDVAQLRVVDLPGGRPGAGVEQRSGRSRLPTWSARNGGLVRRVTWLSFARRRVDAWQSNTAAP